MASIDDGELYLEMEGASELQLQLGLRAARQIFDSAGCSISDSLHAYFEREEARARDVLHDMPADVFDSAKITDDAARAALEAADMRQHGNAPGTWRIGIWEMVERKNRELAEFRAMLPPEARADAAHAEPHYRMPPTSAD